MKKEKRISKFHIYPKRRFPQLAKNSDNISLVRIEKHELYHKIFGLRTPEEIIKYLNKYFWKNNYYIQMRRKNEQKEDTI